MDLYDDIYYALIGQNDGCEGLDWVPNAFAPGSLCDEAFIRLIEARDRISERLGAEDDPDLNQMLWEMETIQKALCRAILELRCL